MTGLDSKWSTQPKTGIADKINDTIKPKGPLKPRVQAVSYTHLTLPTTPYV